MPNQRIVQSNTKRKVDNYLRNPLDLELSPQNMYFWGFLWADGYIRKAPYRTSLEIVTKDFEQIYKYIPNHFNRYDRVRYNRQPQSTVISCREDYVDFLFDNGYKDKQVPSTQILNNPNSYYWFRGLIDGDGCWYRGGAARQFVLTSTVDQDWEFFTNLLSGLSCKYTVKQRYVKNGNKYSFVRMCSKQSLINLFDYIYPSGECDIGLDRKYKKALECIQE